MWAVWVVGNTAGLAVAARATASQLNAGVRQKSDARAFGFRVAVGGYYFTVQVSVSSTKWLLAPTSTPAAFRFTWDSSAGRCSRSAAVRLAGFGFFWRVVIIFPLQHHSVGASPEGATELSHSPERDRPQWDVANDAAVRPPDHASRRATSTNVHSVSVRTTRLIQKLHHDRTWPVSLSCTASSRA